MDENKSFGPSPGRSEADPGASGGHDAQLAAGLVHADKEALEARKTSEDLKSVEMLAKGRLAENTDKEVLEARKAREEQLSKEALAKEEEGEKARVREVREVRVVEMGWAAARERSQIGADGSGEDGGGTRTTRRTTRRLQRGPIRPPPTRQTARKTSRT